MCPVGGEQEGHQEKHKREQAEAQPLETGDVNFGVKRLPSRLSMMPMSSTARAEATNQNGPTPNGLSEMPLLETRKKTEA